jgi:hemolysin activation/secretion protein
MEIVEANFGKVVVEPFASKRLDIDRIVRTINAAQKTGEKLNTFQVDKALALLADLSGVQIQGSLVEGDSPGQTNLMVTLKETALVTLDASSDNTGSRSTGQNRLATSLAINSPLGLGDQLAINTLSSSGTQFVRLSEYMPIGYAGSKFGLNLSHLNYHLVTQDYAALLAKGTADTLGLETTYPLVLSRLSTLTAVLGLDGKHFVNQSQNTVASDYVSRLVNLGLNGTTLSSPMSQTRSSFNMGWVGGQLDLSQSANRVSDANTVKTSGRFNKFKYTVSRDQEIVQGFSFYSSLNGQWASKNLDSSEKFYLGGINGVRAYPSNEAGGALGQLASVELRSRLGPSSLFSGFYDHGRVLTNPNNDYAGASVLNKYALKGYGFSYAYGTAGGSSIKATVARRIGNNPNPTTTGNDQDGSMVKNRVWLNATVPF